MPTIEQLEEIIRNHSVAYERSTAFVIALAYIKEHDEGGIYRHILEREVDDMGLMP